MRDSIRPLFIKILNLCNETIDLFPDLVELTVAGNTVFLASRKSGLSMAVIAASGESDASKQGLHYLLDDSLDEYQLCELLESAHAKGFDRIYIHGEKS